LAGVANEKPDEAGAEDGFPIPKPSDGFSPVSAGAANEKLGFAASAGFANENAGAGVSSLWDPAEDALALSGEGTTIAFNGDDERGLWSNLTFKNPGACFTGGCSFRVGSAGFSVCLGANRSIGPTIFGAALRFSAARSSSSRSTLNPSPSSSSSSSSALNLPRAADVCFRVVSVVRARKDDADAFERSAVAAAGRFFAEGEKAIGRGLGRGLAGGSGNVEGSGRLYIRQRGSLGKWGRHVLLRCWRRRRAR
jgi:hypothetical protein